MTVHAQYIGRHDPFKKNTDQFRNKQLLKFDGTRDLRARTYERARKIDEQRDHANYDHNRELRISAARNEVNFYIWIDMYHQIQFCWDGSSDAIDSTSDHLAFLGSIIFNTHRKHFLIVKQLFTGLDLEDAIPKQGVPQRIQDIKWWRSLLYRESRRRTEQGLRLMGAVSKHTGLYISDFSFARWKESQRRAADLMADAELVDVDSGEIISLEEATKGSTSSLENRRAELMTRIRGSEEIAKARVLTPMFITMTCPSKHHLFAKGDRNPKFNGDTPRQAHKHLQRVWTRVRSKCSRLTINLFGLRIVEPHHDGCPHWHLLMFVKPDQKHGLVKIIRDYALQEDGNEPGALKRRVEVVTLKESGHAAGYVAKYVAKNIDGFKVGEDLESNNQPATETAHRVRAWASTWGIRQFQFFGDAPVSCYRELRRLANDKQKARTIKGENARVMAAADDGDWAAYSALNGGPCCPRTDRPISPHYSEVKPITGVQRVSRFGDVLKAIAGINTTTGVIISRSREWILQFRREATLGPV